MMLTNLCIPAMIYLIFMSSHVLIATMDKEYNHAILQLLLGIVMTLFLQLLCMGGMNIISWIIVFIPFIFYTYMIVIIYHVFGLNPTNNNEDEDNDNESNKDK